MHGSTPRKTPGRLNPPPSQAIIDFLPLSRWCKKRQGVYYRLHPINPASGKPFGAIFFSQNGRSRFDHPSGPGAMCIGQTLAGALMEIFDDHWGPVGDISRSISASELQTYWVSLVAFPPVNLFFAHKGTLSKLGTDVQLLAGDYPMAREWFLCLANHPCQVDGFVYHSRHDDSRRNIALLKRSHLLPEISEPSLIGPAADHPVDIAGSSGKILVGDPIKLADHPELDDALRELQVAKLP